MKARHACVTLGSPRFTRVATHSFDVVSAWFPPHARLDMHTHASGLFGMMIEGAFRTTILGREVAYNSASAWTEPAEERHANLASANGARVLIVQLSERPGDTAAMHRALFDDIVHVQSAELLADAKRLEAECALPDDLTPLVLEGLSLAMLARTARLYRRPRHHTGSESWLMRAVEYLHAHCCEPVQLRDVAREAGVHPSRLAHEFRARMQTTPGEYLRRLRIEWAALQLQNSESTIADIALRAGFADQSHFSRVFRRQHGMTPNFWRRTHQSRSAPPE